MLSFTTKEKRLIDKLNTPTKIQDFLNSLKFNFEEKGKTLKSPLFSIRTGKVHCFEGALLGAYILSTHGFMSYIIHLKSINGDYDHVITAFNIKGLWGALSKTNHAVLRYREPIYRDIHELVLSYFHEYFLDNGQKTLRQYSIPFNLNIIKKNWVTSVRDLWWLDKKLDKIKHYDILPKSNIRKLRKADKIEIEAGKIVEFKKY